MIVTKDLNGIVFNIFNYKENDLIVDIFCYQYGFMQLYVRGGQKTTSKSFFIFKLFNIITFDISKLNLEELSIYKSGTITKVFDYTALSYEKMNVIMLCSELLLKIKQQKDFDIKVYYQDIEDVILGLQKENPYFLLNYFIYKTLIILGCAPSLDSCCMCSKMNGIMAYDIINNGFICQVCYDNNSKYLMDKDILNYLYKIKFKEEIPNNKRENDKKVFEIFNGILNDNAGVYLIAAKYIY